MAEENQLNNIQYIFISTIFGVHKFGVGVSV